MNRFKVFNVGQDSSEEAAREIPTNMESNGAQYRSSLQAPTNEGRKFSLVTLTLYVYILAIAHCIWMDEVNQNNRNGEIRIGDLSRADKGTAQISLSRVIFDGANQRVREYRTNGPVQTS